MDLKQNKERNDYRINWRSGVGEFLSFGLVVPFMLILVCAIFSAAQISSAAERLSYAAYAACRAAVVSETERYAERRADAVIDAMYAKSKGARFITTHTRGGVDPLPSLKADEAYCELEYVGTEASWRKGDMIHCTVYQYVKPLTPFTEGVRQQDIIMMIENTEENRDEETGGSHS